MGRLARMQEGKREAIRTLPLGRLCQLIGLSTGELAKYLHEYLGKSSYSTEKVTSSEAVQLLVAYEIILADIPVLTETIRGVLDYLTRFQDVINPITQTEAEPLVLHIRYLKGPGGSFSDVILKYDWYRMQEKNPAMAGLEMMDERVEAYEQQFRPAKQLPTSDNQADESTQSKEVYLSIQMGPIVSKVAKYLKNL